MAEIRRCGYLQSLKDIETIREIIGESAYLKLKGEYLAGIERENLGLALRQAKRFSERWMAWRMLYPRLNMGAVLYIPYLLPFRLGNFLFTAQTSAKYFIYKCRRCYDIFLRSLLSQM